MLLLLQKGSMIASYGLLNPGNGDFRDTRRLSSSFSTNKLNTMSLILVYQWLDHTGPNISGWWWLEYVLLSIFDIFRGQVEDDDMRMVIVRYSWVEEDPIFENLLTILNLLVAKYIEFFEEEKQGWFQFLRIDVQVSVETQKLLWKRGIIDHDHSQYKARTHARVIFCTKITRS